MFEHTLQLTVLLSLNAVNIFIVIHRLVRTSQRTPVSFHILYGIGYSILAGVFIYLNTNNPLAHTNTALLTATIISFVAAALFQYTPIRIATPISSIVLGTGFIGSLARFGITDTLQTYSALGISALLMYLYARYFFYKKDRLLAYNIATTAIASITTGTIIVVIVLTGGYGMLYGALSTLIGSTVFILACHYWHTKAPIQEKEYDYFDVTEQLSETVNKTIDLADLFTRIAHTMHDLFTTNHMHLVMFSSGAVFVSQKKYKNTTAYSLAVQHYFETEHHGVVIDEIEHLLSEPNNQETKRTKALAELLRVARANAVALLVPIYLEKKLIALFGFGHKKNNIPYKTKDLNVIRAFAHHAATALHKAELYEQVKEYSKTLEQKVRARTQELQVAHEAQHAMLVDISHNLQTPLTILKAELAQLSKKTAESKSIASLEHATDDLSNFIYRLLSLAKLEQPHEQLTLTRCNISDFIIELCEYIQTLADEKNITLEHCITPDIYILADTKILSEAITNILSNAIKYIAHERRITITLTTRDKKAILSIQDTGIGIDAKNIPHIFKRFYRAKEDTRKAHGSGLGLAITKQIIEKHNGSITATSKKGIGTTITIQLPVCLQRK